MSPNTLCMSRLDIQPSEDFTNYCESNQTGFSRATERLWHVLSCCNYRVSNERPPLNSAAPFLPFVPSLPTAASTSSHLCEHVVGGSFKWKDVSEILQLIGRVEPRAQSRLAFALSESTLWSKHPDPRIQFFQATQVEHLPLAKDLLKSLGISRLTAVEPASVSELCNLVQEVVYPIMMNSHAMRGKEVTKLTSWMCELFGAGKNLPQVSWLTQMPREALVCFGEMVKISLKFDSSDHTRELAGLIRKSLVLKDVSRRPRHFKNLSKAERADKDITLAACSRKGTLLEYASIEMKADREVVLEAVKNDGFALLKASPELRGDRELLLEAVRNCGEVIRCAHPEFWSDRQVVLEAVRQFGTFLACASGKLKNDREVVTAAVLQDGEALCFANEDLKRDPEVVFAAVARWGLALNYAHRDLKNDRTLVLLAVTENGLALRYASKELKDDKDVVIAALKQTRCAQMYMSDRLKNDPEVQATQAIRLW